MLLPEPRKMVVEPSKSSTAMTPPEDTVPETVTGMLSSVRPAETVMVPLPGAVAVKFPFSSMVPIFPSTSQVKASASAFREMWFQAAVAVSAVTAPRVVSREVRAVPLALRMARSVGSAMAWTTVEPSCRPWEAVTVMSPPRAGVVRMLPSSSPAEASRR